MKKRFSPLLALPLLVVLLTCPPPLEGQLQFNRLIVVPSFVLGGSCPELISVLAGITDASADNRYLVRLQGGEYFCYDTVNVPSFVTLEGAGRHATLLRGSVPNDFLGLVNLESDSELRHLSVSNFEFDDPPPAAIIGVSAVGVFSPVERIRLVNVLASGRTSFPVPSFAVKATNADVEVLRSQLVGWPTGDAAGTTVAGSILIVNSDLIEGGVSGNVTCRYSHRESMVLDENCLP